VTARHRKSPAGRRARPHWPDRWPARQVELTGLAIGLACGLLVALTWVTVRGSPTAAGQPEAPGPVTIGTQAAAQDGPDPAALDAEWAAYSDRSTCADWAGGDGVSAVSLGPSQIAWFFSDTYLGPAGPVEGFSRISGFVHNSVVVQTTTGAGRRFVTLTGGGARGAVPRLRHRPGPGRHPEAGHGALGRRHAVRAAARDLPGPGGAGQPPPGHRPRRPGHLHRPLTRPLNKLELVTDACLDPRVI